MSYTHGHAESVLRSHRTRTAENSAAYLLPYLKPEHRLLDVGAGPGTITADLAGMVHEVLAVEISEEAAEITRAGLRERGVGNVEVVVADVHDLDLDDNTFDVVHAHQVLQHLGDPVRALREMRRVAKPGGLIAARDVDYGGMDWYPDSPVLDEWRRLYLAVARGNGGDPRAGRRLHVWAREAGCTDVTCSSSNWTYATEAERAWWGGLWADRTVKSSYAATATEGGYATAEDLERIAEGWRAWAADEDGWWLCPHGEILCRVS